MSYGVALRNGIPFTLGTIAALCVNATGQAWSPAALWPTGTEAGMWIDPSSLTSQWQDSAGTTPVATPGTVADSSNPVGLALDIRAGATSLSDPGNHMFQATSTARPLLSARVNLLTYTEDFTVSPWSTPGIAPTQTATGVADPEGGNTAQTWSFAAITIASDYSILRYPSTTVVGPYAAQIAMRATSAGDVGKKIGVYFNDGAFKDQIFVTLTSDWQFPEIASTLDATTAYFSIATLGGLYGGENQGAVSVDLWGPQWNIGSTALPYQSVPGDGSTYSPTGFPIYQKYDGTDDGMATASFAAGTLTSSMDCLIAVRRDSASACMSGLISPQGWYGFASSTPGGACFAGCGSPTVFVDNVQLAGGVAVDRATLDAALTVGDWHIVEFRGLDLSTWTQTTFGNLAGVYLWPGARGDIMLFPSPADAIDRDNARQYLADKYGVTLP